ncbi:MAG: DNA adenine methylase [Anaerolineae bacterium]|nr:DNA adenine methylase [Anaerolineae bacterium]NUQ06519.1 DNA adenine methylase [Anaerolineae bacterium]
MQPQQMPLFSPESVRAFNFPFPSTRYQGSKWSLVDWIWENLYPLRFDTVLDVFGGTGVVSHMFKNAGKQVIYNDYLTFNWNIGLALVENRGIVLSEYDIETIVTPSGGVVYPDFIQRTFQGIYFDDAENAWLDRAVYNIDHLLHDRYKQAVARFALFQACLIKRPY